MIGKGVGFMAGTFAGVGVFPANVVNVKDFGALGNDSANDTTAIQNALNNAKSTGKKYVYVPPGTYRHNNVITVDSVIMFGAGTSTHLKAMTLDTEAIKVIGTAPGLMKMRLSSAVANNRLTSNQSAKVWVNSATNFELANLDIISSSSAGIITINGMTGKIHHNNVGGTKADGIYTTVASDNIIVEYNRLFECGDDQLSVTSYTGDWDWTHHVTFRYNVCSGAWQSRVITLNGGHDYLVHDNYVDGGTACVSICSTNDWGTRHTYNVEVRNNIFRDSTYTGEGTIGGGAIHLYNDVSTSCTAINIHDNTVYNPARHSIFVNGTTQIQGSVTNTSIYSDATHAVYQKSNGGATQVTETNNIRQDMAFYPGDTMPTNAGYDPNLSLPIPIIP